MARVFETIRTNFVPFSIIDWGCPLHVIRHIHLLDLHIIFKHCLEPLDGYVIIYDRFPSTPRQDRDSLKLIIFHIDIGCPFLVRFFIQFNNNYVADRFWLVDHSSYAFPFGINVTHNYGKLLTLHQLLPDVTCLLRNHIKCILYFIHLLIDHRHVASLNIHSFAMDQIASVLFRVRWPAYPTNLSTAYRGPTRHHNGNSYYEHGGSSKHYSHLVSSFSSYASSCLPTLNMKSRPYSSRPYLHRTCCRTRSRHLHLRYLSDGEQPASISSFYRCLAFIVISASSCRKTSDHTS